MGNFHYICLTGTNRRRIYDIINVMEALEMIVKQSKNWYTWLGRASLIQTLAKLRVRDQCTPHMFREYIHVHVDERWV